MKKLAFALAAALVAVPAFSQVGSGVGYNAAPAVTSSLVLKTIPAALYEINVVSGASAGFIMVLDAKAVPADGAVTPAFCLPLAANTGIDVNMRSAPMRFSNGIVVVFSTSGCYSKTASATAFIAGSVQ